MTADDERAEKTIRLNSREAYQQALAKTHDLARLYHEEQIRREELEVLSQTLSATFSSMPDPLVVLDEHFQVERVNPAFLSMLEISELDALGHQIFTIIHSQEFQEHLISLKDQAFRHESFEFVLESPIKRNLLTTIATLAGRPSSGLVVLFHDRSDHKRLEYQKAEFINIAAHELRTPLAAILGYSEIIKYSLQSRGEYEEIESVDAIITASIQLKEIIDELIQFAQLNQGDFDTAGIQVFSVRDIVTQCFEEMESLIREKELRCATQYYNDNLEIFADPSLVKMIVTQLLLNAINFNQEGGSIVVEVIRQDEKIHIRVTDTGIGIPQTDLEAIFGSFYQVEVHTTREVGGLGLGLSIVRYALDQLGGEIRATSNLGEGSSFIVSLPEKQSTLMPSQRPFFDG